MNEIIKWLESPDGEYWSRGYHRDLDADGVMPTALVSVKDDRGYFNAFLWVM